VIILSLFINFAVIGALTFGGGYSSLPLVLDACTSNGWLTITEFSDLITLSEITPGPIAINAAAFAGIRTGGLLGAAAATIGFVAVPFAVVSLMWLFYKKYRELTLVQGILSGLRPCVVALIAAAGLKILILAVFGEQFLFDGASSLIPIAVVTAAFVILRLKKPSPILIILSCGAIGAAAELIKTALGS
jgi:chromate transporter